LIAINDIRLENNILEAYFKCDLAKCKGACCTFKGEYGAPLRDDEISLIEGCIEASSKYLSERSKSVLKEYGFYEKKNDEYLTICIDKQDCVFVYYEGDIAKCSLEKAFLNGETNYRKPISCHLFPIRVMRNGSNYLYYEKIDECRPGIENGEVQNINLIDSVREALIRFYGEEWYASLKNKLNTLSDI
jgi:hypothetical protein